MHYDKPAHILREHIIKFSEEFSSALPKVVRYFITEAIYGIQARQSVRLTKIAHSLHEKISIKKTKYRFYRQLGRKKLWLGSVNKPLFQNVKRALSLNVLRPIVLTTLP
jgi:hypothetical protein